MTYYRCNLIGAAAGRVIFALLLPFITFAALRANAAPYVPELDHVVLEVLPAATTRPVRNRYKKASLKTAAERAADQIELARTSGDPRYLGYAQAALQPWWNLPAPPVTVASLRAQIRQHNHDFSAALTDLDYVLAHEPRNLQARLTRAAIHQVQGDYDAAQADCRGLALLAPPLTTVDCMARVASHRGQAAQSYELLSALADRTDGIDARQRKEIEVTLADIAARLGKDEAAHRHYASAIATVAPDAYTLAAFADFLLDRGRPEAVTELVARFPAYQDLLLRAALAERAMHSLQNSAQSSARGSAQGSTRGSMHGSTSSELARQLRSQYAAYKQRGDFVPSRDYARFLLDIENDAPAALQAALLNWRTQRETADARIVLRAAIACRRFDAAAPVVAFIERNQLEDVRLDELVRVIKTHGAGGSGS